MPYLKLAKPFSLTTILAYKKIVFKYLSVETIQPAIRVILH